MSSQSIVINEIGTFDLLAIITKGQKKIKGQKKVKALYFNISKPFESLGQMLKQTE